MAGRFGINRKGLLLVRKSALVLALALAPGCGDRGTPEDRRRLSTLKATYAASFEIVERSDTYVDATYRRGGCPDEKDVLPLFNEFWMDGDKVRTNSDYTYLNLFDDVGHSCFQLYWDPRAQIVGRSATPYY